MAIGGVVAMVMALIAIIKPTWGYAAARWTRSRPEPELPPKIPTRRALHGIRITGVFLMLLGLIWVLADVR